MSNAAAYQAILSSLEEASDPLVIAEIDVVHLERAIRDMAAQFETHPEAVVAQHEDIAKALQALNDLESKIYVRKMKAS